MYLVLEAELDAMKILLHFVLTPNHASILLHISQVRKLRLKKMLPPTHSRLLELLEFKNWRYVLMGNTFWQHFKTGLCSDKRNSDATTNSSARQLSTVWYNSPALDQREILQASCFSRVSPRPPSSLGDKCLLVQFTVTSSMKPPYISTPK